MSRDQSLYEIWAQSSNPGWVIDNLVIISASAIRYVKLWLDFWPPELELLQHFRCRVFKLCTKFKRNGIIRGGWIIDDLAHVSSPVLRVGEYFPTVRTSRVGLLGLLDRISLNLVRTNTQKAIIDAGRFGIRVQVSCSVSNCKRLKREKCRNWYSNFAQNVVLPAICPLLRNTTTNRG